MTDLALFRQSIKNLIEADDLEGAFETQGIDKRTAELVSASKGFKASRSVTTEAKRKKTDRQE